MNPRYKVGDFVETDIVKRKYKGKTIRKGKIIDVIPPGESRRERLKELGKKGYIVDLNCKVVAEFAYLFLAERQDGVDMLNPRIYWRPESKLYPMESLIPTMDQTTGVITLKKKMRAVSE